MSCTIWWIRRDLRLHDNQALDAARRDGQVVIPLWIFDPALINSPNTGRKRFAFLREGLCALDKELRLRGSRLIVRHGAPGDVLQVLLLETGASAVYAKADHTPYARRRDSAIASTLPLHLFAGTTVHPPGSVLKADGGPYSLFSAFRSTWLSLPLPGTASLIPTPHNLQSPPAVIGDPLEPGTEENSASSELFPAGEAAALQRLEQFVQGGLATYGEQRNRLDQLATSCLSPYLRFGMLSPRHAVVAALEALPGAASGARAWLDELIWRDFFTHVLHHFPYVQHQSFREKYRSFRWRDDEIGLTAWQQGQTGYPVVDAAMRQLQETGWLPNRARMIAASFLSKHLLLDWRDGERWFRRQLLDGDLAANNGNWQWVAGTGTDAAPYFRIFNPITQGKKHDPDGQYVRHWVPELATVSTKFVHEPWQMPPEVQQAAGCIIGEVYPWPIVDHRMARDRALAFYRSDVQFVD
ncbi:MAG: deoxyribodipyrimidine photo-lyase [Anaerolineae bacterium]|nr:deoxyribodipyrimidine photo-lyase [Anaerolineae bacterium]